MDLPIEYCMICYETIDLMIPNCGHSICPKHFKSDILQYEICPICDRSVLTVKVGSDIRAMSSFEKPVYKSDADFWFRHYSCEIACLREQHQKIEQHMRLFKQSDPKFNEKWHVYDNIGSQIKLLKPNDQQISQKCNKLKLQLELIYKNDWKNDQLQDYKVQDQEVENQFVMYQKKPKNKKR